MIYYVKLLDFIMIFDDLEEKIENLYSLEDKECKVTINKMQDAFYDFDIFHLSADNIYKNVKKITDKKIKTHIDNERDEVWLKLKNFSIHYYLSSLPILYKEYIFQFNDVYITIKTDSLNSHNVNHVYIGSKKDEKKYFVYDTFFNKAFINHKRIEKTELPHYSYLVENFQKENVGDDILLEYDINFEPIIEALKSFYKLTNM